MAGAGAVLRGGCRWSATRAWPVVPPLAPGSAGSLQSVSSVFCVTEKKHALADGWFGSCSCKTKLNLTAKNPSHKLLKT